MKTIIHLIHRCKCFIVPTCFLFFALITSAQQLKVGVAGLNHDHAYGLMQQYKNGEVIILGIAEPNTDLVQRYKDKIPTARFHFL